MDERSAEDGVGVDGGEPQAGRHRGVEEQRCAHEPGHGRGDDDERPDEAAQAGSIPASAVARRLELSSCSSRGRSRTAGAE